MIQFFTIPKLIPVVNCNARYIGLFAGRQFGKTIGGWFPRMGRRCLEKPIKYMYIAHSYSLAKEMFELTISKLEPFIKRAVGQPKPTVYFHNGSVLDYRSWDRPHLIKGFMRHEIWFDEIQEIKSESAFWAVLRPIISTVGGTLAVSGQFAGKNWFYREFYEKGQNPTKYPLHRSWQFPAWEGLMFESPAGKREIEEMRASMPAIDFDVNVACIPASNQSAVFREEDLKAITRGDVKSGPDRDKHYILAHDLGEMVDPSADVVFEHETGLIVHAQLIPLRTKHQVQAFNLAALARKWNAQVIIDATGGAAGGKYSVEENVKYYRDQIPDLRALVWAPTFKKEMVRVLSLAIEQHRISIPAAFTQLHRELESYEFEAKAEGTYDFHGPKGQNDNLVAALMMATYGAKAGYLKSSDSRPISSLMY